MSGTVAVVGAGSGLGAAVARRFAREGFNVALLARNPDTLAPVEGEVRRAASGAAKPGRILALACDATEAQSVEDTFRRLHGTVGSPTVLVYNAGAFQRASVLDLNPGQFEEAWRANWLGALLCAQQVLPAMLKAKRGTLLLSGATASLRGAALFASLAVGKFGLRALAQSMAREMGPQGIHVAHIVIDGQIDSARARSYSTPDRPAAAFLQPDALAEQYWQLHCQDATAWTLELDVRPAVEKF
jgi:NAD(P)-dependent dehydrogenase (short-subunit alcohol dehydrogenase family)